MGYINSYYPPIAVGDLVALPSNSKMGIVLGIRLGGVTYKTQTVKCQRTGKQRFFRGDWLLVRWQNSDGWGEEVWVDNDSSVISLWVEEEHKTRNN